MKKVSYSKITLLVGFLTICMFPVLNTADAAPKFVVKLSHEVPENSLQDLFAKKFKDIVEEKTNGEIEVRIFISNQLGDPRSVIEGVQLGSIGAAVINAGSAATLLKDLAIFNIPALLPSEMDKVKTIFDSGALPALVSNAEKTGLKYLGSFSEPYMQLTSSKKPIASPADLKGFKIRTMNSPIIIATYRALGANPTPVPFSELYTALQLKMVDGQENPYDIIYEMHFYEVQKYFTSSKHGNPINFLWMSTDLFDNLPKEYQNVIVSAGRTAQDYLFEIVPDIERKMKKNLLDKGMIEVQPAPELREAFVKARTAAEQEYVKYVGEKAGQKNLTIMHDAVAKTESN